ITKEKSNELKEIVPEAFTENKEDVSTGSAQVGNRKFILVQLPEKTDEQSEAYTAGFKTITAKIKKKDDVYLVNESEIALLLNKVNEKIIKLVINQNPKKVITLDRLFNNNDQLKTNTALQMKDAGIEFKVV
ncbi:MAG TPA: hypothetical protein ENI61_06765, partial [Ignavibacteria bacterium]|nr:hypothetical protein [Ignavibacteria bacterium]